jgi:dihydroflavonol-4-reductase
MQVLVTGATGHLGANVVAHLNRAGVRPRVLLRPTSRTAAIDDLEWEAVTGDVTDADSLAAAVAGAEVVYHVAAMVSFWKRRRGDLDRINVGGTRNVIRACLEAGVGRLVHTSSVAAVGHAADPAAPVDEGAVWNFGPYDLVYADSKHRSERLVHEAVAEHGLSAVVINPALIFGERDVNLNAGAMMVQIKRGWVLAASPGTQAVCDADDVARAHLAAAERGRDGERYIVATESLSYRALFEQIAACVGGRGPLLTAPTGLVRAAGWFGENVLGRLGDREPTLTWEIGVQGTLHSAFDGSKLPRELGVQYTPFAETLEKTRRWLVAAGHLPPG